MKNLLLSFFLIVPFISVFSQHTIKLSDLESDTETKQIREYYKLINKEKNTCKESETFWSYEDELREKYGDTENEYNEEGNEERNELTFTCNGQTKLIIRDTRISKYQVPYNNTIHEEFYFKNDELVFYFSKTHEILNGPDYVGYTDMPEGERAKEIRIYLKNGKIFKYLIKEAVTTIEEEIDASILLPDMENKSLNLESLSHDDYNEISEFLN